MRHSNEAPASPVKDQVGVLSLPGEAGELPIDGAAGAVESST